MPSDIENSLRVILTVAANSYPGSRLHRAFSDDGEVSTDSKKVGDSVAFSIATELKEAFVDGEDSINNLGACLQMLQNMINDVQSVHDGLMEHTMDRIIYDFLIWLKDLNREVVSLDLFQSWIKTHPSQCTLGLMSSLCKKIVQYQPKFAGDGALEIFTLQDANFEQWLIDQQKRVAMKFNLDKDNVAPVVPLEPKPPAPSEVTPAAG